jgi:hypothetical protein
VATISRMIVEAIQSSVLCARVMPRVFLTFYDDACDAESTNLSSSGSYPSGNFFLAQVRLRSTQVRECEMSDPLFSPAGRLCAKSWAQGDACLSQA